MAEPRTCAFGYLRSKELACESMRGVKKAEPRVQIDGSQFRILFHPEIGKPYPGTSSYYKSLKKNY
jgi:hypothetical protein